MADIALRGIEKYFGDNYVIRKLNLAIQHREFLVLLGPSGCGKTTTLRSTTPRVSRVACSGKAMLS